MHLNIGLGDRNSLLHHFPDLEAQWRRVMGGVGVGREKDKGRQGKQLLGRTEWALEIARSISLEN